MDPHQHLQVRYLSKYFVSLLHKDICTSRQSVSSIMSVVFFCLTEGGPPILSDRRIVLLGKAGAGKNKVARVILGDIKLNEESEECFLYEGEQAGKRTCIVNTPGWDRVSIECTATKIKNEIARSVTLCPPGPHALILVFPVNTGDVPSVNEFKSASHHMELLSERVWNHTIVLFLCDGDVEESTITEHIHKAEKLLEKCRGRYYVMQHSESETQVHGLLNEIDSVVRENLGDFFLPQVYYEVIQSKLTQNASELKKQYEDREEKLKEGYHKILMYKKQVEEETLLKQRRGSNQGPRPSRKYNSVNARPLYYIKLHLCTATVFHWSSSADFLVCLNFSGY